MYNFKKADFNRFRDLLAAIPRNCCSGGTVDEDWLKFSDLLLLVADQCLLIVTLCSKKRMNWLGEETLHMIGKKRRAFKLAKQSRKTKILGSTETSVTGSVTSPGRITRNTSKRSPRIWPVVKDHSGDV